jgi:CRP-like cAMP-binding protein
MALLLDTLKSVDFLVAADEATVLRFMVLGKSADFPKGHLFWRPGDPPNTLVIPVSGEAKTTTRNSEGREFIDRFLVSGECFDMTCAIDGLPCPTGAEVVRPGEFFTMPRANFLRFLDEHPEVRDLATRMIGESYRRNMKEREDVALRSVPQRVAEFLLHNSCVRQADGAKVLVHATQAEMAARLGTVREVVSRIFSDFEQRGLIEKTEHGIFVSDWNGLHAEAGLEQPDPRELAARQGPAPGEVRTTRFFLPTIERRRRRLPHEDASGCRDHLGDLTLCRANGCPGAIDDSKRNPAN